MCNMSNMWCRHGCTFLPDSCFCRVFHECINLETPLVSFTLTINASREPTCGKGEKKYVVANNGSRKITKHVITAKPSSRRCLLPSQVFSKPSWLVYLDHSLFCINYWHLLRNSSWFKFNSERRVVPGTDSLLLEPRIVFTGLRFMPYST